MGKDKLMFDKIVTGIPDELSAFLVSEVLSKKSGTLSDIINEAEFLLDFDQNFSEKGKMVKYRLTKMSEAGILREKKNYTGNGHSYFELTKTGLNEAMVYSMLLMRNTALSSKSITQFLGRSMGKYPTGNIDLTKHVLEGASSKNELEERMQISSTAITQRLQSLSKSGFIRYRSNGGYKHEKTYCWNKEMNISEVVEDIEKFKDILRAKRICELLYENDQTIIPNKKFRVPENEMSDFKSMLKILGMHNIIIKDSGRKYYFNSEIAKNDDIDRKDYKRFIENYGGDFTAFNVLWYIHDQKDAVKISEIKKIASEFTRGEIIEKMSFWAEKGYLTTNGKSKSSIKIMEPLESIYMNLFNPFMGYLKQEAKSIKKINEIKDSMKEKGLMNYQKMYMKKPLNLFYNFKSS